MIKVLQTKIQHLVSLVLLWLYTEKRPKTPQTKLVERRWLNAHPDCAACGTHKNCRVHRVMPISEHSGLQNSDGAHGSYCNLLTLCMNEGNDCLLHIGHGGSFKRTNMNSRFDAAEARAHPDRLAKIRKKAARLAL